MSNTLENEIVKVRSEESYCCLDWTIKFKCTCNSCFKGTIKSAYMLECLGLENLYFTLHLQSPLLFHVISSTIVEKTDNYRIIIGVRNNINVMCRPCEYANLRNLYVGHFNQNRRSNYKFQLYYNQDSSDIQVCNYILEGVLKIAIELFKPTEVISNDEKLISSIESDLSRFQKCKTFSDVTFVVGEQEFYLHKAILALRSTVFYAMFEHKMQENTENKVTIKDISPNVMEQVFNYIYTDAVVEEDCEELVDEILVAADKYNLQGLVKICERIITEELNIKNILPILAKANFYKLETLKKKAVDFFIENVKSIIETNEFEHFLEMTLM